MRLRGCATAAVVAALGATLAACGGGSSGATDPSSPLPITATRNHPSTTASATTTLDPNSDYAIINGVRAWAAALNEASRTSDLTPLKSAATNTCSCIAGTAQSINYLASMKLHLTVAYAVASATVLNKKPGAALVRATISTPPYQAIRVDGTVFKNEPADSGSSQFSMRYVGSRWLVDTIL